MSLNISGMSEIKQWLDQCGFVSLCSQCNVHGGSGDEESSGKRQRNHQEKSWKGKKGIVYIIVCDNSLYRIATSSCVA